MSVCAYIYIKKLLNIYIYILKSNANTQSLVHVLIKASGYKTEIFVKCLPSVMYVRVFYCGKSSDVLEAQ